MKKLTRKQEDAKYKLDKEKKIAIAVMLGLKALTRTYTDAIEATDAYKGQVFYNDLIEECWSL